MADSEDDSLLVRQMLVCEENDAEFVAPLAGSKLGISRAALKAVLPINGLRHAPSRGTSGWYIWSGDYSDDLAFFEPLHVEHAESGEMVFARYLALAPGWRFLLGEDGYEDVWFDQSLLEAD